jgi:hypothetical protein
MGPRTGVDVAAKRKMLPYPESNPGINFKKGKLILLKLGMLRPERLW